MITPPPPRQRELGEFVRSHRERLAPARFGLPEGRRRTPGLRREEVAQLSGLSVTWYTFMEQGRDVSLSPSALQRLARALQLSPAERAYLFELAGRRDPETPPETAVAPHEALLAIIRAQETPAYLLDPVWDALAWNAAAARLFTGWLEGVGPPNLMRYIFRAPEARQLLPDWEERARRVIAEFRVDYGQHLEDPRMTALIAELSAASPVFTRLWHGHVVLAREGGPRHFRQAGTLGAYEQVTLTPAQMPHTKLVILTPVA